MAKQDDWIRITVRLPADLHADLLSIAASGPNSLNAEIVSRLRASIPEAGKEQQLSMFDWDMIDKLARKAARETIEELADRFPLTNFKWDGTKWVLDEKGQAK